MGKRAGGREQEVRRLLPLVKKEVKLEQKETKCLNIKHLEQKAHDIAMRKRHPKAKDNGKGPKHARKEGKGEVSEQELEGQLIGVDRLEDLSNSKKRKKLVSMSSVFEDGGGNKNNMVVGEVEQDGSDRVDGNAVLVYEVDAVACNPAG